MSEKVTMNLQINYDSHHYTQSVYIILYFGTVEFENLKNRT